MFPLKLLTSVIFSDKAAEFFRRQALEMVLSLGKPNRDSIT
jgi:hypothetical protein